MLLQVSLLQGGTRAQIATDSHSLAAAKLHVSHTRQMSHLRDTTMLELFGRLMSIINKLFE